MGLFKINFDFFYSIFEKYRKKIPFLIILSYSIAIMTLLIVINTEYKILDYNRLDMYLYLIQSLEFSGNHIVGNSYNYLNNLSPLIPFLTSLVFRLGFINETAIYLVTGVFYVFGIIGMYLLLNLRFDEKFSMFGAILWGSLSIVLKWAASGSIDIPSVTLTIFSLYFIILATEKNQKYFYLGLPLAILAFFAKYTGGLVFPLIILYLLSKTNVKSNIKKYLKNFMGGCFLGLVCVLPFIYNYLSNNSVGFVNQAQEVVISSSTSWGINIFYYIINVPLFIINSEKNIPWIILDLILAGIILLIGIYSLIPIYKKIKNILRKYHNNHTHENYNNNEPENYNNHTHENYNNYEPKEKNLLNGRKIVKKLFIINILSFAVIFLTVGQISFIYSEILVFICFFTFSLLFNHVIKSIPHKNNEQVCKNFSYDLLMYAWFFSYLIFFSSHSVKGFRYFLSMTPPFAFFIVFGMSNLVKDWKFKYKKNILPLMTILLILFSFTQLTMSKNPDLVNDANECVLWLKNHDPDYENKIIYSDKGEIFTWYLKKEVIYFNNPLKQESAINNLIEKMEENNGTYFISQHNNLKLKGYNEIMSNGHFSIYEKEFR